MRAVDTNVLVRLIARDHPVQTAAADHFVARGAWVSTVALAEAIWVLDSVYGLAAPQLASVVEMLLEHEHLVLQDSESARDAVKLFRSKPALGFSDCLLLSMARRSGHIPFGTFDRKLAKADGAHRLEG